MKTTRKRHETLTQIARNSAETVLFHKISTPRNYGILRNMRCQGSDGKTRFQSNNTMHHIGQFYSIYSILISQAIQECINKTIENDFDATVLTLMFLAKLSVILLELAFGSPEILVRINVSSLQQKCFTFSNYVNYTTITSLSIPTLTVLSMVAVFYVP